ncbi:MAG: T9SS type A sorting domain-containing protein [FCB group bacterium]|nr:T9SS type A sorting domain-containing protein [FCB group bacterium]
MQVNIRFAGSKDRFGTDVSTGVYIYRLETGSSVKTKKLIVLK